MSAEPDPLRRAKELAEARAQAIEALQRDAQLKQLRTIASRLGGLLVDTADDGELWKQLGQPWGKRQPATQEQRLALDAATDVDWEAILNEVGYKPPPPAALMAEQMVKALSDAMRSGQAPRDLKQTRKQVREIGTKLVELGGGRQASPRDTRRWLRRGIRAAGVLGIAAGVAAAVHAPPVVALALPIYAIEPARTAVTGVLKAALNRITREKPVASRPEVDPADPTAFAAIHTLEPGEFGSVLARWQVVASGAASSPDLLTETQRLISDAFEGLYVFWDAAIGAPWFKRGLPACCGELQAALRRARQALLESAPPDVHSGVAALEKAEAALTQILGTVDHQP